MEQIGFAPPGASYARFPAPERHARPMGDRAALEVGQRPATRLPGFFRGLSGKLLALTVVFVMLAEVLIFVPSMAAMRLRWLSDQLSIAAAAGVVIDGL